MFFYQQCEPIASDDVEEEKEDPVFHTQEINDDQTPSRPLPDSHQVYFPIIHRLPFMQSILTPHPVEDEATKTHRPRREKHQQRSVV